MRDFAKSRKREFEAVMVNLNTYLTALKMGTNPLQIKYGFVRPERHGVVAIDQSGAHGKGIVPLRLYIYPDVDTQTLFLLTLGDKRSQKNDISYAHEFVNDLRKERQANEPREHELPEQGQGESIHEGQTDQHPADDPRSNGE